MVVSVFGGGNAVRAKVDDGRDGVCEEYEADDCTGIVEIMDGSVGVKGTVDGMDGKGGAAGMVDVIGGNVGAGI